VAWPWKANEVSEFELVPDALANEPLNVHLALRIHELGIPGILKICLGPICFRWQSAQAHLLFGANEANSTRGPGRA
jgi:hypothetical protein